jgi:hypothetical protein
MIEEQTRAGGPGPDTGGQAPQTPETHEKPEGAGAGESLLAQAGGKGEKPEDGEAKEGESQKDADEKGEKKEIKPLTAADLVIPEGKVWDEEVGGSFLDIVNEANIPPEVTNKLIALYSGQQDKMFAAEQAATAAEREKYQAEIAEWEKAAKADKEYGGQKWDAAQTAIARGRDRLATPEAVAFIEEYKLGSHPEILRMFYRAGLLLGEDSGLAAGGGGAAPGNKGEALYREYKESLERAGIIKREA